MAPWWRPGWRFGFEAERDEDLGDDNVPGDDGEDAFVRAAMVAAPETESVGAQQQLSWVARGLGRQRGFFADGSDSECVAVRMTRDRRA